MTDSVTTEVRLPQDKPPAWVNSIMKWMLTTPGVQSVVGQGVALLTFTGRKTGKTYNIPVSYHRKEDTVTVITKRVRNWWHNFETPADVKIRLAGRHYAGTAEVETGDEDVLAFMLDYLDKRPIDAKTYGLARTEITEEKVARIIPQIVLIRIHIAPVE
jgi:deazaflavin-dependent oxidoreductase (nitroreductase family)